MLVEALERRLGDLVDACAVRRVVARQDHVRLQMRSAVLDPLVVELGVEGLQDAPGRLRALLDRVLAVLEYLGLHDRNEAGLLTQRRIPGERMRIRPDAVLARSLGVDRIGRAPLGEACAEL